jgi:sec-independent protein translocase protein TatB
MFDIAPTELLLCAVVALVVIGPKDLPKAMRTVGQFVAKVRGIGRHFRSGFDEMVREAELKEMEETWAKENARIMREHPPEEIHDAEYAHGTDVALPAPVPPAVIDAPSVATPVHEATPILRAQHEHEYEHDAAVARDTPPAHGVNAPPETLPLPGTTPRHDVQAEHDATPVHESLAIDANPNRQPGTDPTPVGAPEDGHDGDHKRMDQK